MSLSPSLKEEPPSLSPSATAPAAGVKSEEDGLVIKDELPTSFPVSPDETLRDFPPPKLEDSVSPKHSESSESSTPPPVSGKRKPKVESTGPQLIGHLPKSEEQARATFIEIIENHYQYGTLGRSREALESMLCDCQYEHGVDSPYLACGEGSDCINRLTQVECLPDECRCRFHCQNQRYQRKQYASIDIVLTERKGFGLRAAADLPKDTFVYEYVGDVVSQPSMKKRMRDYAKEGIQHFYFMMLQKDEFIDATKRGGIGRFANHSCNPNCYVAKWAIGQHVRMGIFASRTIQKDEELTFNYNVDRYGHDAQVCYCGEVKCVGFIGGKTQTDLAAMDDLYLDALGITDEVEKLGLKGNKKKKSRKLDEDFMPILKPLILKDVPKVIQAVRQTSSRKVLAKLLTRIKITEDMAALRQIMRLRGFSLMTNILEDYSKDNEIPYLAMECMSTWPLLQRNKVEDSKISIPVQRYAESAENEKMKELAQKLLDQWAILEYAYRIPKRMKGDEEDENPEPIPVKEPEEERPLKRSKTEDDVPKLGILPLGRGARPSVSTASAATFHIISVTKPQLPAQPSRQEIAAIIAAAARANVESPSSSVKPSEKQEGEKKASRREKGDRDKTKKVLSKEEKEAYKEKKLKKLVGAIVVKCMSRYQKHMDHDTFKKYAKELTETISEKEKKSSGYKEGKLDSFSEEKRAKIKKFAKEYIVKVLRKLKEKKRKHSHSSVASTSKAANGDIHEDAEPEGEEMGGAALDSLVAEAMSEDDDDNNMDIDEDGDDYADGDVENHERTREDESPEETEMVVTPVHTVCERVEDPEVKDPRLRNRLHSDDGPWDLSQH